MKKLFLLIILCSFVSINAQSNFKLNGQVMTRGIFDNKDFNSDTGFDTFTEMRTRLGASFTPLKNVSVFIQMQDSRVFGTEPSTLTPTNNLDLHQGYFVISNLFELPFALKVGRMEVNFGPQRLIGSVGWSRVGRSFDGAILTYSKDKVKFDLFNFQVSEFGNFGDTGDKSVFGFYSEFNGLKNLSIQPFIIIENVYDVDQANRITAGLYSKGIFEKLSGEFEFAYQFGELGPIDISAFMLAANANYQLGGRLNPQLGAGVDYLSGDDPSTPEQESFNTLYATNHKYYGYMDYFPGLTNGAGLLDIHAVAGIAPVEKLSLNAKLHIFKAAEELNGSKSFGTEIDLTAKYNYNKNVSLTGGFSFFSPGEIIENGGGLDPSSWAYLMAIINF